METSLRVLAVSLLLAACGPADISAVTRNLASSSDADAGSGTPTVTFYGPPTWTYAASALLVPGTAETLQYDLSRLSQCQATTPWTLTAYFSADGAPATSQSVSSTTLTTGATSVELPFEVPFATDLAFWFEIQSAGCQVWDSNYGNNFHYQVQAPTTPVIHFNADFTQTVQGTLVAGQPITIDYALSRLPNCRGTYGANPAWASAEFAHAAQQFGQEDDIIVLMLSFAPVGVMHA